MIVINKPIITEKSMKLAQTGLYTFSVNPDTTKPQVAKFVADKFKVQVLAVKIINVKGRSKMQRKVRGYYLASGIKKALVQVGKGQKIALFETEVTAPEATVTKAEGDTQIKEKRNILKGTKVKIEKIADVAAQTTQRKVITGK